MTAVRRLLVLLAACGHHEDKPVPSPPPPTTTPSDAFFNGVIIYDAPPPPPPDATPPPTRDQAGTRLAAQPAIALAYYNGKLYALSQIDAIAAQLDPATGAVTELDRNPEKRGVAHGIVAGPDGVWWDEQVWQLDDCTLMRAAPNKPAEPVTVAYGASGPLLQDGKQLYIGGRRSLDRMDKQSQNLTNIATNKRGIADVAQDDANLYWIQESATGAAPAIMARDKLGAGEARVIAKSPEVGGKIARALILDGNTFYWSRGGDIVAMPKAGGTITVVAEGSAIDQVTAVGANLYWIERDEALMRAPKAGGAATNLGFADHAAGLVSDGKALYWGTPYEIRKLTLP